MELPSLPWLAPCDCLSPPLLFADMEADADMNERRPRAKKIRSDHEDRSGREENECLNSGGVVDLSLALLSPAGHTGVESQQWYKVQVPKVKAGQIKLRWCWTLAGGGEVDVPSEMGIRDEIV